jgi:hypothetical protein
MLSEPSEPGLEVEPDTEEEPPPTTSEVDLDLIPGGAEDTDEESAR